MRGAENGRDHPDCETAMPAAHPAEPTMLGYPIDAEAAAPKRFRVRDPASGDVLAVFEDLPAAERFVVLRELRAIESRPRHPAY